MSKPSAYRLMGRALVAGTLAVAVVLGLATGALQSVGRRGLYAVGLLQDGGDTSIAPDFFDHLEAHDAPLPARPADPVLPDAPPSAGTRADKVAERVRAVGPTGGGRLLGEVIDATTGTELYSDNGAGTGIPASTQKVLTCLAALDAYGPDHRFDTVVKRDPANPTRFYLVGGGDPYLSRATLTTLAQHTADQLKAGGQQPAPIELVVDTTLFSGPTWNPDWTPVYHDYVADTSALWVDGARTVPGAIGRRDPDPSRTASNLFVDELKKAGVGVSAVRGARVADGAAEVSKVSSAPLENIVEQILIYSDNDAAEVLFRHIGRTGGRGGSIEDARTAIKEILSGRGVWVDGMKVLDGSGLSRNNLSSPTALARAVRLATLPDNARLRAISTGMSTAGVEGTLAGRFIEEGTAAGRGLVRAKTGTLTQVHTLAGYVRDADGSVLVYAFIINGEQDEYANRVWLDRVTTALAGCGCR